MTDQPPPARDEPDAVHASTEDDMPDLGATLRAALAPSSDVRHTARRKVDRALHARSAAAGYTSLLSCAVDTFRHLLTKPGRPADRYDMRDEFHLDTEREAGGDDG